MGGGWVRRQRSDTREEQYGVAKESAGGEVGRREEERVQEQRCEGRKDLEGAESARLEDGGDDALLNADAGDGTQVTELREADRRKWLPMQVMDWFSFGLRVNRRHAEIVLQAQLGG